MNVEETLKLYDLSDNAVRSHGFTDYHRDYQIVAELGIGDELPGKFVFLFRGCVEVEYKLTLPENGFSVDDVFIDYEQWEAAGSPEGYVWGVKWACAYPGWKYVLDSGRAAVWAEKFKAEMHEVLIETNAFALRLIFHDLAVRESEESVAKVG